MRAIIRIYDWLIFEYIEYWTSIYRTAILITKYIYHPYNCWRSTNNFANTLVQPDVLVGACCSSFLVSYVVRFCFVVFVLYLVFPKLPMSLDCPFLITQSVFSNFYLLIDLITNRGKGCNFTLCLNWYT